MQALRKSTYSSSKSTRVPRQGSSTLARVRPISVPTYHVRSLREIPRKVKAHNVVFHGLQCCNDLIEWNSSTGMREWPVFQARNVVYDNCHDRFIRGTLFADVFPRARSIYLYQSSVASYIPFLNRIAFLDVADKPKIFTTSINQYKACYYPCLVLLTPEEMEGVVEMYMNGSSSVGDKAKAFNYNCISV